MLKPIQYVCIGICLLFLAGGCATMTSDEIKPLTDTQLRGIFSRAKDARNFWITVYQSGSKSVQFSGANRLHPEHVAEREFIKESSSTAPMIIADNGREETIIALIDTTAARSWLDLATFERTGAIPLGPPAYDCTPRNVNDNFSGYACVLTKMRFDQLHMENALSTSAPPQAPWDTSLGGKIIRRRTQFWDATSSRRSRPCRSIIRTARYSSPPPSTTRRRGPT